MITTSTSAVSRCARKTAPVSAASARARCSFGSVTAISTLSDTRFRAWRAPIDPQPRISARMTLPLWLSPQPASEPGCDALLIPSATPHAIPAGLGDTCPMLRRGLAPATLVAGVMVVTWLVSGVGTIDIVRFLAYEIGFVALPGAALLWALR